MKKILNLVAISSLLLASYSCNSDLLDNNGDPEVSQPTASLTSSQLEVGTETNTAIPPALLNGIYAQMITTGTGGTGGHDDFGHKSYHVFSDMMTGDMALSQSNYGWYRASITEFQAMEDFTFGDNRQVWRYYYRIIRSANSVIASLGGNDAIPELESNRFSMGQAKAMRAHSYFYLTQFYQREYNPTEEILPMYTEPVSENVGKSTAQEIYELMENDLNDAISLLSGFNRDSKNKVNQDVAKMIKAQVLGAKGGRDAEVATLTKQVIDSGNYSILAPSELIATSGTTNGFKDVTSSSWMWGIDVTETNGLGLVSWWGQIDSWSYSYAWAGDYKAMDKSLYDAMPSNDARKNQFFGNSGSGRYLQPLFKFRASGRIGGESRTVTADYVYMRVEEAYLLNAEANARNGNDAAARTSLKALMSRRVPSTSYIDALSGDALKAEIYLQTRLELWGEGKSFFAMKRNKATTVRGTNHLSYVGTPIPYNDEKMQFEIPQGEIQNNPFISNQNL